MISNSKKTNKDYLKIYKNIASLLSKEVGSIKPYIVFLKLKSYQSHPQFINYKELYTKLGISRNTWKKYLNILLEYKLIEIKDNILYLASYDKFYKSRKWKCNKNDYTYINDSNINDLNTVIRGLIFNDKIINVNRKKNTTVCNEYRCAINNLGFHIDKNILAEKIDEFRGLNLKSKYLKFLGVLYSMKKVNKNEFTYTYKKNKKVFSESCDIDQKILLVKDLMETVNCTSTISMSNTIGKSRSTVSRTNRILVNKGLLKIEKRIELFNINNPRHIKSLNSTYPPVFIIGGRTFIKGLNRYNYSNLTDSTQLETSLVDFI